MLHFQYIFVIFEVLKPDIVVLFEQFLEIVLLLLIIFFEPVVLVSELSIFSLQLLIDNFDFCNLRLFLFSKLSNEYICCYISISYCFSLFYNPSTNYFEYF